MDSSNKLSTITLEPLSRDSGYDGHGSTLRRGLKIKKYHFPTAVQLTHLTKVSMYYVQRYSDILF